MRLEGEARLVRIFIGESDLWKGRPLYEALVHRARGMGMAGATVLRGIEGFGASSVVHTTRILRLSEDLPIVIELVDTAEKVSAYLEEIEEMVSEGMVTTERVEILKYRGREAEGE